MANDKEMTTAVMHECFVMLILLPFCEEVLLSLSILVVGYRKERFISTKSEKNTKERSIKSKNSICILAKLGTRSDEVMKR
jgi:hypothetical protein